MINGNLKIIDRKKDLVKLQGGEYISLNKVETILKLLSFVDNCCIIADPTKSNCVCLICPNPKRITDLLSEQDEVTQTEVNNLKDINGVNEKSKELNRILEKNSKVVTQLSKEALNHCLSTLFCELFSNQTEIITNCLTYEGKIQKSKKIFI